MEWKDRIKSRRLDLGLTLEKVAQAVGVSAATISRWERGEISSLNADKVACLGERPPGNTGLFDGLGDSSPGRAAQQRLFQFCPRSAGKQHRSGRHPHCHRYDPETKKETFKKMNRHCTKAELYNLSAFYAINAIFLRKTGLWTSSPCAKIFQTSPLGFLPSKHPG